jgi:hypothetical protein
MSTLNIDRCVIRDTAARKGRAGVVLPTPSDVIDGATRDEEVVLVDIFTPIREDFPTT